MKKRFMWTEKDGIYVCRINNCLLKIEKDKFSSSYMYLSMFLWNGKKEFNYSCIFIDIKKAKRYIEKEYIVWEKFQIAHFMVLTLEASYPNIIFLKISKDDVLLVK